MEVPPDVANRLDTPVGSEVVALERLRRVDGEPLVHVVTFLPAPRFSSIVDKDLRHQSLYAVLEAEFGVRPHGGVRSIDAEVAGAGTARLLGIRKGAPVLKLDAINLDAEGRPFEFFSARYRGDQTTFQIWLGAQP
jgi:GntR family transcriptional regulator